jgi:Na+-translocating ferredoxin:NAD+ oxidoreductase RnfG subunit
MVMAFICALAACSPSKAVPEYISALTADRESIDKMEQYQDDRIIAVYAVGSEGASARAVVQEALVQGFNDVIRVLVMIDATTGITEKVQVLEHYETEDYGGYVTEDWFLGRFAGKDTGIRLRLKKKAAEGQEDIVAITGATYTSQAVVDAVNLCLDNYRRIIEEVDW